MILPVGGPIYQGALTAIDASGKDVAMLGVDADVFETDPNTQEVVLTSILKNMKVSTYEAIMAAGNDETSTSRRTSARSRTTASASRRSTTSRSKVSDSLAARAGRGEGRHHRRLDPGHFVPARFVISS